jgi:hypothetical protein
MPAVRPSSGHSHWKPPGQRACVTRTSKSVVAGVDIRQWVCVVSSLLRERERHIGTGDDELPVSQCKTQVQDGQARRSQSVKGVPAGDQGQSAGMTGSTTAVRTKPGADSRMK